MDDSAPTGQPVTTPSMLSKMSPTVVYLLGVASVWPLLWIGIFIALVFGMIALIAAEVEAAAGLFACIFPAHFLTIILANALLVFYVIYLVKDETLDSNEQVVWVLVTFFFSLLALPVVYYVRVWRPWRAMGREA